MALDSGLLDLIDKTPGLLLRHNLYQSLDDPKFAETTATILVPSTDYEAVKATNTRSNVEIRMFDRTQDLAIYNEHDIASALLYLPYPYLVPGGRFNEMYGWDTAFPVLAWASQYPKMMREQIDNQLYQIRCYGKVLNSNRAYHLGRSHPPLINIMIEALLKASTGKPWAEFDPDGIYKDCDDWLRHAYQGMVAYHEYWTSGDRLAGTTGLSRYWDELDSPAPEVIYGEPTHFSHALEHFRQAMRIDSEVEDTLLFYDPEKDELTPLYYRADRTMRASGFDPTGHWNYGALRCIFHAPVCLNSLLYRFEKDLAHLASHLNIQADWDAQAQTRRELMGEFLWDAETSTFQDYDFIKQTRNGKTFASIFHPLWAGVLDPEAEYEAVMDLAAYGVTRLDQDFGLSMSEEVSGSQWDHPYGWPPIQLMVCLGLLNYGFTEDAKRIAANFCALVERVYKEEGSLYEKYNVVEGSSHINVVNGYSINVSENGTFLWTAAVTKILSQI